MKKLFQVLAVLVCFSCFALAATATPVSIVYGVYLWGGEGHELGFSAWEGVKTWVMMISAIIPGGLAYLAFK